VSGYEDPAGIILGKHHPWHMGNTLSASPEVSAIITTRENKSPRGTKRLAD